jgi:hypothetical protein
VFERLSQEDEPVMARLEREMEARVAREEGQGAGKKMIVAKLALPRKSKH